MGRVSVIIPTWNRADTIQKAVQSALDQTCPPLEVLVCDDGSSDNTFDIVKSINDPRVRWIPGYHSGLPAVPRNRGIGESQGEWLAFLDSDDEWQPEKLEKQLSLIRSMNDLAACSNAHRFIPNKGIAGHYLGYSSNMITLRDLLHVNYIICSSVIVHKSLFSKVFGFSERPELKALEDYDLWLRMMTLTNFSYISDPLIIYHDNPAKSIRSKDDNPYRQQIQVLGNFLHWGKKQNISSRYLMMARKKYYAAWFKHIIDRF